MLFTKLMDALFSNYTNLGTGVPKTTKLLILYNLEVFSEVLFHITLTQRLGS